MDNYHKWIESSDPLAEQMRREAQSTRPEFSASLDVRLRAAVRAAGPSALPTSERRKRGGQGLRWALAAAALVAVAIIGLLIWQAPRQRPGAREERITEKLTRPDLAERVHQATGQPPSDDLNDAADMVENTASGLGDWMKTTVDDNQWAGLDRDAATAVATVIGPVPFDLSESVAAAEPKK